MDAEMVIDARSNEPELLNAKSWQTRKGLMEVTTGRNVAIPRNGSQSQENADEGSAEVLAGPQFR